MLNRAFVVSTNAFGSLSTSEFENYSALADKSVGPAVHCTLFTVHFFLSQFLNYVYRIAAAHDAE